MAFRLKHGRTMLLNQRGNFVAFVGLGALLVSSAQAQVIIGGHGSPAVRVDNSVLERLGPLPSVPPFFVAEHNSAALHRPVAAKQHSTRSAAASHHYPVKRHVAARHLKHHKTAIAKAAPSRLIHAPVRTASSLNQIIHLIPPKPRLASAAPAGPTPVAPSQALVTHQETVSTPTKATVAAFTAPASTPAPKRPASSDVPTPPMVLPQQAREETPPTPVTPPSQPVTAAARQAAPAPAVATPAATPIVTASAKPAVPSMTVTPNAGSVPYVPFSTVAATTAPLSATPVAAAAPAPMTVTPNVPAAVPPAPPLQMAAATTVGNATSTLKFKTGAADLGNGSQPVLDTIANRLLANDALRVQIVSHATGGADDAMEARRVSLARAVAVRAYLIEKGVRSLRIDVRALGNRADSGPVADQVDLLVVSQ
ncbi:MAG TPA: OmpA family protein [Stellaceae bacterium]|nr:OmpA family protein [Stellaceae bacterium]